MILSYASMYGFYVERKELIDKFVLEDILPALWSIVCLQHISFTIINFHPIPYHQGHKGRDLGKHHPGPWRVLFIIEAVEHQVLKDTGTKVLFNALGTLKEGVVGVFCDLLWPSIACVHGQGPEPLGSTGKEFIMFLSLCSTQPRRKDAL